MNNAGRLATAAAIALSAAVALAGCQNGVSGPSLTATTSGLTLVPSLGSTPDLNANMNTCCCHVSGTVKNTSSVDTHIELRFPATSKQTNESVGMGLSVLTNVPAGGSKTFVAVGIYAACNTLDMNQITRDQLVNIKGLWSPQ
jgi:hypothetical protein